jgi:hypothetical protein
MYFGYRPNHCRGVIGLRMSNLYIMDYAETSGITMVLEDDVKVNMSLVLDAVRAVPRDWDIIRLDCWGFVPWNFPYVTPNIFCISLLACRLLWRYTCNDMAF